MNERIKEIALQSGTTGNHQVWFTRPEMEKFAKLIILECAEIAKFGAMGISNHYPDAEFVEHQVKHHFGVKD